jgi:hypothetical protein
LQYGGGQTGESRHRVGARWGHSWPRVESSYIHTGANPTVASYNAGAEKIYNPASSLVCSENKNSFLCCEKRSTLLPLWLQDWGE